MRLRHLATRLVCEFVRETAHGWLCVECANRNHWLCYPREQWGRE